MIRTWVFNLLWLAYLVGCQSETATPPKSLPSAGTTQTNEITLATTTSTQDSGLLDELLPAFKHKAASR